MNHQISQVISSFNQHHHHVFEFMLAITGIGSAGAAYFGWIPAILGVIVSLMSIILLGLRIEGALDERKKRKNQSKEDGD